MSIRPMGTESFHVDGRTDGQTHMTQLIVAFRNVGNTPKSTVIELFPCACQEGKGRNGGSAPFVLKLGAEWMLLVSFTPRVLYLRRNPPPQHPFNRRHSGSRCRLGRFGEEKHFLLSQGPNRYFLVIQPLA